MKQTTFARDKASYQPSIIEPKWQAKWQEEKIYQPNLDAAKNPFYNLMMFPYPSAAGLHVGGMYTFSGVDAYGRFQRMRGNDVFEPFGLDGFGIHSENYALKIGAHPMDHAQVTEDNFYRQMQSAGLGIDWSRTVETWKPDYYKWTQWLFTELFKAGLAYRAKAAVNFCPSCKTVLADEQVIDSKCERCGTMVEKRDLEQWFFRITKYADRLLSHIPTLDWAEKVKIAQRNWIGKSEGMEILFQILQPHTNIKIKVFTTRPDTLYGATFLVISPEHPLVDEIIHNASKDNKELVGQIKTYREQTKEKATGSSLKEDKEKTGIFSGAYALNPVNNQRLPIWIADYVLMNYGTGAIMAVPAHDERDFSFAKTYDLPIIPVIANAESEIRGLEKAYTGPGKLINSGEWNGWEMSKNKHKVIVWLEKKGVGKSHVTYHLRDWLISRQRYWGPPIPMIYCEKCAKQGKSWFTLGHPDPLAPNDTGWNSAGWYPVPKAELPVKLPYVDDYKPLGTGRSPLDHYPEFYETNCPECGSKARRETDVSDTFLDSAWYFLKYLATDWENLPFPSERLAKMLDDRRLNVEKENGGSEIEELSSSLPHSLPSSRLKHLSSLRSKFLPVTIYIGGAEHAVLHLLYARFMTMVLHDLGYLEFDEPFSTFYAHGLIIKDGAKMSKSKGNVIVPDVYIQKYGADTLRTYLLFLGRFTDGGDFQDTGIEGINRFLKRVWILFTSRSIDSTVGDRTATRFRNNLIKEVTEGMEQLRFNTAIAKIMTYYNALAKREFLGLEDAKVFLQLLAPFAPHMAEELWQRIRKGPEKPEVLNGRFESIHTSKWPKFDPEKIDYDTVVVAIQINGKLRGTIEVSAEKQVDKAFLAKKAQEEPSVKIHLSGKEIKKTIVVPGKIVNFVI